MTSPTTMRAMVFEQAGQPLVMEHRPVPEPAEEEVLIQVRACGVCRTDLHIVDGELSQPKTPLIPGHEIAGITVACGSKVDRFKPGTRVGVPWLGYTCGKCRFCLEDKENLCDAPLFTGYTRDGGYAEYTTAHQRYCFPLPDSYDDLHIAPLMCAGLIGYRSYRMLPGNAKRIGLYGFGAAAHIITQVALGAGKEVYAFTRPGDQPARELAYAFGATWAGDSTDQPPVPLDGAIIFAPVGTLVPAALQATVKGGTVVCGGIYMSDIPSFPYHLMWEERAIRSVANLTREDGEGFMDVTSRIHIKTEVEPFALEDANEALDRLRSGRIQGAAVLKV